MPAKSSSRWRAVWATVRAISALLARARPSARPVLPRKVAIEVPVRSSPPAKISSSAMMWAPTRWNSVAEAQ